MGRLLLQVGVAVAVGLVLCFSAQPVCADAGDAGTGLGATPSLSARGRKLKNFGLTITPTLNSEVGENVGVNSITANQLALAGRNTVAAEQVNEGGISQSEGRQLNTVITPINPIGRCCCTRRPVCKPHFACPEYIICETNCANCIQPLPL